MGMNEEATQKKVTLESLAGSIQTMTDSIQTITESIGGLPTRIELKDMESRLEKQIDDVLISTKNEFDRVHVRLDDLEKYTVDFKKEFEFRSTGLQNQLDNIYKGYPNRQEYTFLNNRVKRIEKAVFS